MALQTTTIAVRDYDLAATLGCGQAFRWEKHGETWTSVVQGRRVELRQRGNRIAVRCAVAQANWDWLVDYLQIRTDLAAILATFPDDEPMRHAVTQCRGLRLLRQEPWECLASFILSSTKQIVQIRQIIRHLCERHGHRVAAPADTPPAFAFPTAEQIAALSETQLRACKMGFRAPYLLGTARAVATGEIDLEKLRALPLDAARAKLIELPGVGRKIADCVLLFGYGFDGAFPIDVWVLRALRELYFSGRKVNARRIEKFAATHFGPHAGYAQQYLFHYMRTKIK